MALVAWFLSDERVRFIGEGKSSWGKHLNGQTAITVTNVILCHERLFVRCVVKRRDKHALIHLSASNVVAE